GRDAGAAPSGRARLARARVAAIAALAVVEIAEERELGARVAFVERAQGKAAHAEEARLDAGGAQHPDGGGERRADGVERRDRAAVERLVEVARREAVRDAAHASEPLGDEARV